MNEEKIYIAKVWKTSNNRPLIKLSDELLEVLPIKIERTLFVKRKEKSIEIFDGEQLQTKGENQTTPR